MQVPISQQGRSEADSILEQLKTHNKTSDTYGSGLPESYGKQKETEVRVGAKGEEDEGKVFIVQGKIALEAVEDKILVLLDKFKTGYECKTCDGTGILQECPDCAKTDHKGLDRFGNECKFCLGSYNAAFFMGYGQPGSFPRECSTCKGIGATLIVPETTKGMPTSGIIVSCGPNCVTRSFGERVLFGAHTGYYLPFKGNVRLRLLREDEVMCLMYKIDPNASMEDFQLLQEPIDNSGNLR